MIKHNTPAVILLYIIFSINHDVQAQFDGLRSFAWDTVLRVKLKEAKVRTITETTTEYKEPYFTGKYFFDRDGRTTETWERQGRGVKRRRTEYNTMGQITKEIHYSDQDSSNVTYWAKWVYDNKWRRLKEITGSYQNGKAVEQVSSESKYSEKSKYRTEKQEFYAGKLSKKVILVDSMAGIYTYHISYEFREDKTDRSGRRQGEKKMERSYETGNRRYENEVEYMVNGRLEAAEKIKTYYWLYDEKKRVIESGKIEYEEAYMNYIAQHPEELAYGVYSPRFVKDVLAGKVEGQKETFTIQSYDDMGHLTEKEHFRKKYSFKYNEKGQVTEQNNLSDRVTDVFTYNEQGLIIKMVSTTTRNGVAQHPSTAEYTYTFY